VIQEEPTARAVVVDDVAEPDGAVGHGGLRGERRQYTCFSGSLPAMSSLPQDPDKKHKSGDRRFTRLQTSLPGVLAGRKELEVDVLDVSLGGCLLRSKRRPEPGAILDLRCGLGPETFRAKVRVREASVDGEASGEAASYLVGLEFVRLAASDQDLLREFLESESRRRRGGPRPPA
jgi:PilZ domain